MKEIEDKIKELLLFNDDKRGLSVMEQINFHAVMFNELKELALKHKTILGRTIMFQMADSYAIYLITKVNKKSVKVNWIDFCDGYMDKRLGKGGLIDMDYVLHDINAQDKLAKFFS